MYSPVKLLFIPVASSLVLASSFSFTSAAMPGYVHKIKSFFVKQHEVKKEEKVRIAIFAITGAITDATEITKKLYKIRNDASIHGVLIKIDSFGGAPGSSQIISQEIAACATVKPVVVLVENSCLSGALFAAVEATKIIAPAAAEIGSIGVVALFPKKNAQRFKDLGGVAGDAHMEVIASSPNKLIFNEFGPALNEAQRSKLQQDIMHSYELFYRAVAKARKLDPAQHTVWGDAQIFSASKALELGLIDKIGSFSDALEELLTLIKERLSKTGEPELLDL